MWLAKDLVSGKTCAVKQYQKAFLARQDTRRAERVLAEKEFMDSCDKHPFLTTLYLTFQTSESLFLAIDLSVGGDLLTVCSMHYQTGMPEATARHYCACLSLALRWMHARGWIYRDLKLENILIDAHGAAKLCDFGFVKRLDPSRRAYTVCGTAEYTPPELLRGRGQGVAGDWWALGVLLHEMFTGYNCFGEEDASEKAVMEAIMAYAKGGADAAEQLELSVLKAASYEGGGRAKDEEPLSKEGAAFMRGLLNANEEQRLGPDERLLELMRHPWMAGTEWNQLLCHGAEPPWLPPTDAITRLPRYSLKSEDAAILKTDGFTYDAEKWEPQFSDFGPMRSKPWPMTDSACIAGETQPNASHLIIDGSTSRPDRGKLGYFSASFSQGSCQG